MTDRQARRAEWRAHWTVVLAAFLGISLPGLAIQTVGLVMDPLEKEFGWNRTEISAGITLATMLAVFLNPFVGAMIDRWGVRRIALPGIILTCGSIAALGLANGSTIQWLMLWTIYGLCALSIKITTWTLAITSTFKVDRSLALSIAMCGSALPGIVIPPLTQFLADSYGWRHAYWAIGAIWGVPTFILCFFFLYGAHERATASGANAIAANAALPGLSLKEAIRSLPLYRIGLATLITLLLGTGLVVHKVPLLTEAGITRHDAALLASLTGVAAVVGKLATGWLMQRFDAGLVAGVTNASAAIALVFLLEAFRTPFFITISMMMVGYASGTKIQICAYLTSIYAGMRNFGKIFGVMSSIVALAAALGPLLSGMIYDLTGGYDLLILIGIPASVLAGLLLIRLGDYPEWSADLQSGKRKLAIA